MSLKNGKKERKKEKEKLVKWEYSQSFLSMQQRKGHCCIEDEKFKRTYYLIIENNYLHFS